MDQVLLQRELDVGSELLELSSARSGPRRQRSRLAREAMQHGREMTTKGKFAEKNEEWPLLLLGIKLTALGDKRGPRAT
jgi:hypothetical protein